MTLKCKARRYLPPFFVIVKVATNHSNFKLSTGVEKNPGPTQNITDLHETIIKGTQSAGAHAH